MQMDAGLDTGPVLLTESIAIGPNDSMGSLTRSLAGLGARLVIEALSSLDALRPQPQDPGLATHAPKISKSEAAIDWNQSAIAIERRVRALDPAPGAETRFSGETVKIREAASTSKSGAPGEVLSCDANGIVVACGSGALLLKRLQRAGAKPLPAAEFARGMRLSPGDVFGPAVAAGASALPNPLK
jgi:methionyl-tRNA formyltransferase